MAFGAKGGKDAQAAGRRRGPGAGDAPARARRLALPRIVPSRRPRLWHAGAAVALSVFAIALTVSARDARQRRTEAFAAAIEARSRALAAQLLQARSPYSVLIGDSHAERLFLPTLCGAPVVNAGLSGATTSLIDQAAARLAFPTPADTIVVIAGTNDLLASRGAGTPEALAAFRAHYTRLLTRLRPHARRLVAVPIPSIDRTRPGIARSFVTDAVPRYTAIIAEVCAEVGCTSAPLFEQASADFGVSDGVHAPIAALVRPGGVRDKLERLCDVDVTSN